MRPFVVIPPTEPVVTWEEADAHLELDGDLSKKTYVESLVAAASGHIDGPDGWLGRALGVQTIEARLDNFDCGSIRLPYKPVIDIVSVHYATPGGNIALIDPDQYELLGPSLVPVFGKVWPAANWQREAVRVRYRAGYDGEEGRIMPAPIKQAILLMVGDLYKFRETSAAGAFSAVPMSTTVERLLAPFRVYM